MNKHAVKAANLRSKYIVDKYHYGISCNKCSNSYKEDIIKDFRSFCYTDICSDSDSLTEYLNNNVTDNFTSNCNTTITEIEDSVICNNIVTITDCNALYSGCTMNNFEDNATIYDKVITDEETIYFTLSSIIIGSKTHLSTDTLIEINPDNIVTKKINGNNFIMNIINYINNLKINGFILYPYFVSKDKITIETDSSINFTITTKANSDGDSLTRGVILTQDGLQSVQLTVGGTYTPVASLISPESTIFESGVICSQYSKC